MKATDKSPVQIIAAALARAHELAASVSWNACPHSVFRELHSDVEAGSECVTAVCAACLRTWTIFDAQHCDKGERPNPFLPTVVAPLQAVPLASRQERTESGDVSPHCGEVVL